MQHKVYNFVDSSPVQVEGHVHGSRGKLVSITQAADSLRFQFSMRPEQARHLATALVAEADALDALPEAA